MLQIIVNDQEVDLGDLKGITLQYNSNLFEFESVQGSYSIPFNLPLSPRNRLIFEYIEKLGNTNNEIREYDCEIWHSGIRLIEGLIKSQTYKDNRIVAQIYVDNGYMYKSVKDTMLNEMNLGGDKEFSFKAEYDYTADDFLLYEVNNPLFFDGSAWASATLAINNVWNNGTAYLIGELVYYVADFYICILGCTNVAPTNASYWTKTYQVTTQNFYIEESSLDPPYIFQLSENAPCIITPFPLLYKVLEYLFTNLGYDFTDDFFTDDDYMRINIFNVNNAIQPDIYNEQGFCINKLDTVNIANHVPSILTSDFLIAIQNFFNVIFYVSQNRVSVIDRNAILISTAYDDFSAMVNDNIMKELLDGFSGYSLSILRDDADDNISFIENYGDYDSVIYDPTGVDFTDVGVIGDIAHDDDYYYRYKSYYNDVEGQIQIGFWKLPYDSISIYDDIQYYRNLLYFQSFSHNDKELAINLGLSTLSDLNLDIALPYDDTTLIYNPQTRQKGNTYVNNEIEKNPFTLRLLTYGGMDLYGANTDNKPFGTQSYGTVEISPQWSYLNRWADFIAWYAEASKCEYEAEIILKASDLKNFDFTRKKLIQGSLFFIKSLKVQLTRESIAPAKAVMIRY